MLFPTFCTQALLSLALTSFVAGEVVSADDQLPDLSDYPTDVKVIAGVPEFHTAAKLRIRDSKDASSTSELVARALSNDENEALRLHNVARAKRSLQGLTWDDELANHALDWATELAKRGKLDHTTGDQRPNEGENLASVRSSGTLPNPVTVAANVWINEEPSYHNEVIPQGDFNSYGHYTQAVWNSTTKVGIATASDGKGGWYIVARYSPPGNWVGQTPF